MTENERALTEGLKKARDIAMKYLSGELSRKCREIVMDAVSRQSGWKNFTGNTITSYACGLYYCGKLIDSYVAQEDMDAPVRVKVDEDEFSFLVYDYDGNRRSLYGEVHTDRDYGANTSMKFLTEKQGLTSEGFYMVLTTGTEYSTYIMVVRKGNVLQDTHKNIGRIMLNNLKPIK